MFKHNLGDKVREHVTGLTGIVVSRSEHLYGCARYWVQPQELKDGKPVDGGWFDEDALELREANVIKRHQYRVVDEVAGQMRLAGGPSTQPGPQTGPSTR